MMGFIQLLRGDWARIEHKAHCCAVAVMPGAFRKGTFLDMFKWVHQKGYEGEESFQQFHARSIRERVAAGVVNTD